MSTYPVDVSDIVNDLGSSIVLDDELTLGDMTSGDTVFVAKSPVHVSGTLTNAGDGVVVYGTVTAKFETDCSRCLEPFIFHMNAPLEGLFTTADMAEELPEDQEWELLPQDGIVDLVPSVDSALRLELPIAPLHAHDCAGICPTCGVNLNLKDCDCPVDQVLPGPFDALKSLFPEEGEDTSASE